MVEDSDRFLALYSHPGTTRRDATLGGPAVRGRIPMAERIRRMTREPLKFRDTVSGGGHLLTLTPPRAAHSFWLFWNDQWNFERWYINLQTPLRRNEHGTIVQDHILDIVALAKDVWRWKDEDELSALVEHGIFSAQSAAAIREEGERVVSMISAWTSPFCDGWEKWRPNPSWPRPLIPESYVSPFE